MAVSNITRNLRDGELIIRDGTPGTPQSLTVLLDEGDLSWTVRSRTIEVTDRGSIADGHTRPGDEEPVALSFAAKWTQLIGKSANAVDPLQLYETLMFLSGTDLISTSAAGEERTLQFEFTALDPSGVASERITFSKVYRETLTMSEGNDANLISFSGRSFEVAPLVERV
jgi:hypothetical protein